MPYSVLPVLPKIGAIRVCRPEQGQPGVTLESSALLVMTDLRRVAAVVTSPHDTVDQAHAFMMQRGVRMLLVLEQEEIVGIITSNDILGEKPVAVAEEMRVRHHDLRVADIMTPADRLEAFDMHVVQSARVGQVVASLQRARRHHALVVQTGSDGQRQVRGIFSLSQIARQLGMALQLPSEAKSFAELETALL